MGRFVAGLGVGNLSVGVPMFQSECCPKEIRGAVVASYQLMITIGESSRGLLLLIFTVLMPYTSRHSDFEYCQLRCAQYRDIVSKLAYRHRSRNSIQSSIGDWHSFRARVP